MGNLISFNSGGHSVLVNSDKIIYAEELGGVKMKLVLDCGDSCREIEVKAFVSDIIRAIEKSK